MSRIAADYYSAIRPFVTAASGEPKGSGPERLYAIFGEGHVSLNTVSMSDAMFQGQKQ